MGPRKTTRTSKKIASKAAVATGRGRRSKKQEEPEIEEEVEEDEVSSHQEEEEEEEVKEETKRSTRTRSSTRKRAAKPKDYELSAESSEEEEEDDFDGIEFSKKGDDVLKESVKSKTPTKSTKRQKAAVGTWKLDGTLFRADFGAEPSTKICGFDMDWTLIKTKSGRKFPTNAADWVFWHESVPKKVKQMHDDGYKIVIFTNQGGVSKGQTTTNEIKTKLNAIQQKLDIPIQVFASTTKDVYRKPALGMWEYMEDKMNGDETVDRKKCIYVGDAAGRPAEGKIRKKDFSDGDLKFALNIGAKFQTPEEFFFGQKQKIPKIAFNPSKFFQKEGDVLKSSGKLKYGSQEIIVFVGSPASGKSTFWKNHLSDYVRVNRDTLKDMKKCFKVARESVEAGKSVVVDNTNPDVATRANYIEIAEEHDIPCRAFYFGAERAACLHLDTLREANKHREHLSKRVGETPLNFFKSKFVMPSKKEGFKEVHEVNYVAGPFENDDDERVFWSFIHAKQDYSSRFR